MRHGTRWTSLGEFTVRGPTARRRLIAESPELASPPDQVEITVESVGGAQTPSGPVMLKLANDAGHLEGDPREELLRSSAAPLQQVERAQRSGRPRGCRRYQGQRVFPRKGPRWGDSSRGGPRWGRQCQFAASHILLGDDGQSRPRAVARNVRRSGGAL